MAAKWAVVVMCVGAGCGLGLFQEESGGALNLPTQGTGPYDKPDVNFDTPADEPYVVVDSRASLEEPTVLVGDNGFRRCHRSRRRAGRGG